MNKKNSIKHKIVTSKYFELSGLLLLIILYSCIVQTKSGNFLTIGNIHNVLKEIVVYGILSCALGILYETVENGFKAYGETGK